MTRHPPSPRRQPFTTPTTSPLRAPSTELEFTPSTPPLTPPPSSHSHSSPRPPFSDIYINLNINTKLPPSTISHGSNSLPLPRTNDTVRSNSVSLRAEERIRSGLIPVETNTNVDASTGIGIGVGELGAGGVEATASLMSPNTAIPYTPRTPRRREALRDQHGFPAQELPPITNAQICTQADLLTNASASESSASSSSSTAHSNRHVDNDHHSHTHVQSNVDTNPYHSHNPHIYSSVSGPFFVASPVQCLSPESTLTCNGWCERPPSSLVGPLPDVVSCYLSLRVTLPFQGRITTDRTFWWRWL